MFWIVWLIKLPWQLRCPQPEQKSQQSLIFSSRAYVLAYRDSRLRRSRAWVSRAVMRQREIGWLLASLNLHVNGIAIRRVASEHFNERPFRILHERFPSLFSYFNLWFAYPLFDLMLERGTLRAQPSGLWKVHHEITGDEWTFGHGRWLKTDAIIYDTIKSPRKR